MGGYAGEDSIARRIKEIYVGVEGVARKIKAGYVGVDGVARKIFPATVADRALGITAYYYFRTKSSSYAVSKNFKVYIYPQELERATIYFAGNINKITDSGTSSSVTGYWYIYAKFKSKSSETLLFSFSKTRTTIWLNFNESYSIDFSDTSKYDWSDCEYIYASHSNRTANMATYTNVSFSLVAKDRDNVNARVYHNLGNGATAWLYSGTIKKISSVLLTYNIANTMTAILQGVKIGETSLSKIKDVKASAASVPAGTTTTVDYSDIDTDIWDKEQSLRILPNTVGGDSSTSSRVDDVTYTFYFAEE